MHRDIFLASAFRWTAAAAALTSLTACEDIVRAIAESCPDDPSESGGVDWPPDIVRPVFYGFEDLTEADGPPLPLRIWYPTYEGFLPGPPLLHLCVTRWPVVLFLHGQLTADDGAQCDDPLYNTRWESLPRTLAKAGYIVLVPRWDAQLVQSEDDPIVAQSLALIDWVRTEWDEAEWVDAREEAVAVAGHSFGAVAAAHVARARAPISAYVGLGGVFTELGDPVPVLSDLGAPTFFMWVAGDGAEDLDGGARRGAGDARPSARRAHAEPGVLPRDRPPFRPRAGPGGLELSHRAPLGRRIRDREPSGRLVAKPSTSREL